MSTNNIDASSSNVLETARPTLPGLGNSSAAGDSKGNASGIRLPPISFISGIQRPLVSLSVNPLSMPKLSSTSLATSEAAADRGYNSTAAIGTDNGQHTAQNGSSPHQFEIRRLSTSPVVSKPPVLPSFDHHRHHQSSNSPLLAPGSERTSNESKPAYKLPSISSFQSDIPTNRSKINSILNNDSSTTPSAYPSETSTGNNSPVVSTFSNHIHRQQQAPQYTYPPQKARSYSSSSNIKNLLNNEASPASSSPQQPVEPQTRIIIHQHHPSRFNASKEPSEQVSDARRYNAGEQQGFQQYTTESQYEQKPSNTDISSRQGSIVNAPPPQAPVKPFVRPKIAVVNDEALAFAQKFPRKHIGTLAYALSPTKSLQELLSDEKETDPKLEAIYKKEIRKNHVFLLPELRDHVNSIISVRIPSYYLHYKNNPNLSVQKRSLWGTDIYTDDSDVVAILKHCGFIYDEIALSNGKDAELHSGEDEEIDKQLQKEQELLKDLQELVGPREKIITTPASEKQSNVLFANLAEPVDIKKDNKDQETTDEHKDDKKEDDNDATRDDEEQDKTANEDTILEQQIEEENLFTLEHSGNKSDITAELLILPTLKQYQGSFRNNLNSRSWTTSHDGMSVALYSVKYENFVFKGTKNGDKYYAFVENTEQTKRKQSEEPAVEPKKPKIV